MDKPIKVLLAQYYKVAGRVVGDYFLRIRGNDESKRSLEAQDFMTALLTGKNIMQEWKLLESEDYLEMVELAHLINKLLDEAKK